MLLSSLLADSRQEIFGSVSPPPGVDKFNSQAGSTGATSGIGIILFASHLIQLITIVAGLWVFFNFVSAGFLYITSSGESATHTKVKDQITMSVLGLVIIIGAYTATALISLFLFGRADYILNPVIQGPTP
jgi:hypothetical protein